MKAVPPLLSQFLQGEEVDPSAFEGSTLDGWVGAQNNTKEYLQEVVVEECYRRLLEDLAPDLAEKKIHALVLGGVSLWGDYYPLPGSRRIFDVDVWVSPDEEEEFCQILKNHGFEQQAQYQACWNKGILEIDLHTHPINSERAAAFDKLYHFDAKEIYERGDTLPACPNSVWRRPGPEDLWVQHALHAIKHEYERLNLVVDLHFLLQRHLPTTEIGQQLWAICTPALKLINCATPLSTEHTSKLATTVLKEREQRPFLAGLRLLASCGSSPWRFWWALAKGNPNVHRESGGAFKRYQRIAKRI